MKHGSWVLTLPLCDGRRVALVSDGDGSVGVSLSEGDDDDPMTVAAGHCDDLGGLHLFLTRARDMVEQEAQRSGQENSTLYYVRGVAARLVALLDQGDLASVRATLERYALPPEVADDA